MIVETPAIVLKKIQYGDTSVIANCFTREYGKVGIMVRGAQRKKSPRNSYFQPTSFIDIIFYHKPNRDLHTLSKVSFRRNWIRFQDDLKRISYALATVELVEKTITDEDAHEELFDELINTLQFFHDEESHFNLCFWYFELQLLRLLGFQPHLEEREFPGFVLPDPYGGPNSKTILELLMSSNISDPLFRKQLAEQVVTSKDRHVIGNYITSSLEYHFETYRNMKSLKILKQLLS